MDGRDLAVCDFEGIYDEAVDHKVCSLFLFSSEPGRSAIPLTICEIKPRMNSGKSSCGL